MESVEGSAKEDRSWAVETYLRFLPNLKGSEDVIDYVHEEITGERMRRTVMNMKVPTDSNTIFVSENGFVSFEFDKVFDGNANQAMIFDVVAKSKVHGLLDGINSTVFAYGQTGTGKTFTVCGGEKFQDRGLIPRTIGHLFEEIRARQQKTAGVYKCQISFTEVYKEDVYDLLDPQKRLLPVEQWSSVQVLESDNGLTLRNVNVFEVENEEEALSLYFMGTSNRVTGSTAANMASSRSHAIFSLIVETQSIKNGKTVFTYGKVNLVDLAGSERVYKSNNSSRIIKEAKSINLSLHYLEQVIIALREQVEWSRAAKGGSKKGHHIPYRNSVLTNILRDSLGGNCRTCFIFTVASELVNFEETMSTCRFAERCGEVKIQVHANAAIGLSDQLKEMTVRVKVLEQQVLSLERENDKVREELDSETTARRYATEPRTLTEEEKQKCRQSVQELLLAAKESAAVEMARVVQLEAKEPSESEKEAAAAVIDKSQDVLYESIEKMDKAVLIELSSALGGLVQSMYLEREKTKIEEQVRLEREARAKAEALAKKLAQELEDKERRERESRLGIVGRSELNGVPLPTLSELTLRMVVEGASFNKIGFLGRKTSGFYSVSADMMTLHCRQSATGGDSVAIVISSFESLEFDGGESRKSKAKDSVPIITLKGKSGGSKTLSLEFCQYALMDQNRSAAVLWADALARCVERANIVEKARASKQQAAATATAAANGGGGAGLTNKT